MTLEELCPENRSRAGTIELERWASSSVCVYVSMWSQIASMQAFKPLYLPYVWQLCSRARGPCRTRQGCVTPRRGNGYPSRYYQLVFFDFTAILIVNVRPCGIFTFTQSMVTSKNVVQGTHHVRKSSRPFLPPLYPPTHLIVGARNCVRRREKAWFRGYVLLALYYRATALPVIPQTLIYCALINPRCACAGGLRYLFICSTCLYKSSQ